MLQTYHTRLSSFLTFKAGHIEELPGQVGLPMMQWLHLEDIREAINQMTWTQSSGRQQLACHITVPKTDETSVLLYLHIH